MERKAYDSMLAWKGNPNRKAMLVRGMRQIGKTYLIQKFVEENYDSYAYINLEENREIFGLFDQKDIGGGALLDRFSFASDVKLMPGRSAIVLDGIQACLPAYSALKSLVMDGRYDIIASGSLLGVKVADLQRLSPMGYVDTIDMIPMDFEEFLWAMGLSKSNTDELRNHIQSMKHIDDYVCSKVNNLFRRYMVIGGMPAAVRAYAETRDYNYAREELSKVLRIIRDDSERYSKGVQKMRISACLDSVPEQLSRASNHFEYISIEKHKGGVRVYGPSLLWLKQAGIIQYCYNLEEPVAPLSLRRLDSSFKVYLSDTGILTTMMGHGVANDVVNSDFNANNGAVMENAIACALLANGYDLMFYGKRNSTLEVDFVINICGEVTAVEVKSGKNKRARSLGTVFRNKTVARAVKVSDGNVFVDENGIENYPLFGPSFFQKADDYDIPPVDDIGMLGERISKMD